MRTRLLMLSVLASAVAATPRMAMAQIRNTSHDLSASSANSSGIHAPAGGEQELCKFCHTPHNAASTTALWNHNTPGAASTVNWGTDLDGVPVTKTKAGTLLPLTLPIASRRCLACHDGSIALGDLGNAGRGVAGVVSGGVTGPAGTVVGGVLADSAYLVGKGGNISSNHPVGIPYAAQKSYNNIDSQVDAAVVNSGIAGVGGFWPTTAGGACSTPSGKCLDTTTQPALKGSFINLIPNAAGNLGIECTTCHEPHRQYANASFLRADQTNTDTLCASCHRK